MREFLPHQKEIWERVEGSKRLALFLEMRLGKTILAIRWVRSLQKVKSVLLIAPLSVLGHWEDELEKEDIDYYTLHGLSSEEIIRECSNLWKLSDKLNWFLVNYEAVRTKKDMLGKLKWDATILDESTLIKTPTTKTSSIICSNTSHVPHRALLSGNPNPESLLNLFQQFKFLYGGFCGCSNYWSFRDRYFRTRDGYRWFPKPGSHRIITKELSRLAIVMKRRQAKISTPTHRIRKYVFLPEKIAEAYKLVEEDFSSNGDETVWRMVVDIWLSRISGGEHKLNVLTKTIKRFQGKKIVVWFRFNDELNNALRKLRELGFLVDYITGAVSKPERQKKLKTFQSGKLQVLLCQVKCLQYGVNLAAAQVAIRYSTTLSYSDNEQARQRVLHPLKKETTVMVDLITKDTIDEDIYNVLGQKKKYSDLALGHAIKHEFIRRITGG